MGTLVMSERERRRLAMFSQVKRGQLSVAGAGRLLGLSERQTRRLWKRYGAAEDAGLVHAAAAVAPPRWEGAVLAAAALLESSYQSQVDLAALAQQVGVSPAYLSRCFSKRMGMGVVEFTHRLRIEEACRLLRWSDMTISAVAMAVGYGEIAYFSRCFRRHTGRSPRQYRQQGPAAAPFEPGDNALQRLPVAAGE